MLVLGLVGLGALFALPTALSPAMRAQLPDFLPSVPINLGLDLQGGSHLSLEVDLEAARKERLELLADDARTRLRDKPLIVLADRSISGNVVRLRLKDPADSAAALTRLRALRNPVGNALGATGAFDSDVTSPSPGVIEIRVTEAGIEDAQRRTMSESIEVIRRRIDQLGTRETSVQRQGETRIIVQVPGESDPARIRTLIETTAKMTFNMVDESVSLADAQNGVVPFGAKLLPTDSPGEPFLVVRARPAVTGEELVDAQGGFSQTGEANVTFRFNGKGARAFGNVSSQNVCKRFAIVLDERIISAPVINEPILGGSGQISGNFTTETANDLAVLLRAGSLPAPLKVVESRTVGAELGADSVRAGFISALIALGLVAGFILLVYGVLGLFANLGLIANIALLIGLMAGFGATLTLPGIAGIILTMGMAVDANVLVYERVREEIRNGRSPVMALEAGYSRTFLTIFDANITTLLAAAIMFYLGSGPVKGFAVTLSLGIFTSVLTSFWFVRLLTATWIHTARPKKLAL